MWRLAPDGSVLASASRDGTVRIWPTAATPQKLCDKLTANMSPKQWRDWISPDPSIGYRKLCPGLPAPAE
jgi:WD40 repeat protein